MRIIFFIFFLSSCSGQRLVTKAPSWVEAIRSGDESLKVTNGNKTFYRRIAGSKELSQQTSCNLVVMKAEEDLKKEFPHVSKIPYVIEVLYYDKNHNDCAVTISIQGAHQIRAIASSLKVDEEIQSEDEASRLVLLRSDLAMKYALTGLTKIEFERFSNEKVHLITEKNHCSSVFNTNVYSIHGLTHVCWKGDVVAGYCTTKDKQCWTRTP